MYQLLPNLPSGPNNFVRRVVDNTFIPKDPANTDYQAYLAWLEEGNEPLPEDAPAEPQ